MTTLTSAVVLLHLFLLAAALRRSSKPTSAEEPTLLQILLCTAFILMLSLGLDSWPARITAAVIGGWLWKLGRTVNKDEC